MSRSGSGRLAADSPVIQKIARDEVLSEADSSELEATIFGPDLAKNSGELGKAVTSTESILVSFIKRVLGMYGEANPAANGSGMRSRPT